MTTQVLDQTKSTLKHTEETLQTTEKQLDETTTENNENKHLVKEHTRVEGDLHGQATELLGLADTATDQIERLHGKVERKTTVEEHNKTAQAQLQDDVHAKLSDVASHTSTFVHSHGAILSALKENIEAFVSQSETQFQALATRIGECQSEETASLGAMSTKTDAFGSELEAATTKHKVTIGESCATSKDAIEAIKSSTLAGMSAFGVPGCQFNPTKWCSWHSDSQHDVLNRLPPVAKPTPHPPLLGRAFRCNGRDGQLLHKPAEDDGAIGCHRQPTHSQR